MSQKGKTTSEITHIQGGGNNNGGYISVGGKISHDIGNNTQVYVQGEINRYQDFHGNGGKTSGSGTIGIQKNF